MYKASSFPWDWGSYRWRCPLQYRRVCNRVAYWALHQNQHRKAGFWFLWRLAACFGRCTRCIRDKTATTEVQLWKFLKFSSGFWRATLIQKWRGNDASITDPKLCKTMGICNDRTLWELFQHWKLMLHLIWSSTNLNHGTLKIHSSLQKFLDKSSLNQLLDSMSWFYTTNLLEADVVSCDERDHPIPNPRKMCSPWLATAREEIN